MNEREKKDRKQRKKLLHDQERQRQQEQAQRIEIAVVVLNPADQGTDLPRTKERSFSTVPLRNTARARNEIQKQQAGYLNTERSTARFAYTPREIRFAIMYFDELPNAIYKRFSNIVGNYKYTDAEWNNYIQTVWQLTDGDRSMVNTTFETRPDAISIVPAGEDAVVITVPALEKRTGQEP